MYYTVNSRYISVYTAVTAITTVTYPKFSRYTAGTAVTLPFFGRGKIVGLAHYERARLTFSADSKIGLQHLLNFTTNTAKQYDLGLTGKVCT